MEQKEKKPISTSWAYVITIDDKCVFAAPSMTVGYSIWSAYMNMLRRTSAPDDMPIVGACRYRVKDNAIQYEDLLVQFVRMYDRFKDVINET